MTLALLDRFTEARDRLTEGTRTFPDKPGFKWTLARLLAAAPDDRLRNARGALTMAEKLLGESQKSLDDGLAVGETYAMALAESGQYATAAAVQRDVRTTVQKSGVPDAVLRRIGDNLNRYERGLPCRHKPGHPIADLGPEGQGPRAILGKPGPLPRPYFALGPI
jgi:hypothetical protein